jgi:hypothetical protein
MSKLIPSLLHAVHACQLEALEAKYFALMCTVEQVNVVRVV